MEVKLPYSLHAVNQSHNAISLAPGYHTPLQIQTLQHRCTGYQRRSCHSGQLSQSPSEISDVATLVLVVTLSTE